MTLCYPLQGFYDARSSGRSSDYVGDTSPSPIITAAIRMTRRDPAENLNEIDGWHFSVHVTKSTKAAALTSVSLNAALFFHNKLAEVHSWKKLLIQEFLILKLYGMPGRRKKADLVVCFVGAVLIIG